MLNAESKRRMRKHSKAIVRVLHKCPVATEKLTMPERTVLREMERKGLIMYDNEKEMWVRKPNPGTIRAVGEIVRIPSLKDDRDWLVLHVDGHTHFLIPFEDHKGLDDWENFHKFPEQAVMNSGSLVDPPMDA